MAQTAIRAIGELIEDRPSWNGRFNLFALKSLQAALVRQAHNASDDLFGVDSG